MTKSIIEKVTCLLQLSIVYNLYIRVRYTKLNDVLYFIY